MATNSNAKKNPAKPLFKKRPDPIPPKSGDPVLQVCLISADAEVFKKFVTTTPVEFACAYPGCKQHSKFAIFSSNFPQPYNKSSLQKSTNAVFNLR